MLGQTFLQNGVYVEPDQPNQDDDEDVDDIDSRDPAYFGYYAQFVHQQNMLQDTVRTSLYHSAIVMNGPTMFRGKIVADIGAGSGILSYFAAAAGAAKVYAIEASGMAARIQKMVNSTSEKNAWMSGRLEVVKGKVENVRGIRVDTLISEPIGVLLVHERMIESYLYARDNFLKPGGSMIPSNGTIFLAPFTDANLWTQTMAKVRFWEQQNFYGVDFSPLAKDAKDEIFAQPVVGNFDHRILLGPPCNHFVDFCTVQTAELLDFVIPINWIIPTTGLVHGIAGWFDINLGGLTLTTSPQAEQTHWQQVRFLFKEPLAVNAFESVRGWMRLAVNKMRSYDIIAELVVGNDMVVSDTTAPWVKLGPRSADKVQESDALDPRLAPDGARRRRGAWSLHEQTYWYVPSLLQVLQLVYLTDGI
ncbi:S-adenosyl-L-methionine-dependent methyltransferase [Zopfochytrium polystomum]|nr:S-adenosyl-L-methionine-dependent methyltransferase [Zopfochytrium polystomum]